MIKYLIMMAVLLSFGCSNNDRATTPDSRTPPPDATTAAPDARTPPPDAKTPVTDVMTPSGDARATCDKILRESHEVADQARTCAAPTAGQCTDVAQPVCGCRRYINSEATDALTKLNKLRQRWESSCSYCPADGGPCSDIGPGPNDCVSSRSGSACAW